MLLQSIVALSEGVALHWLVDSYASITVDPLAQAFGVSSCFTPDAELKYNMSQTEMFKAQYYEGWNILADGSKMNHNVIDFLQYNVSISSLQYLSSAS